MDKKIEGLRMKVSLNESRLSKLGNNNDSFFGQIKITVLRLVLHQQINNCNREINKIEHCNNMDYANHQKVRY